MPSGDFSNQMILCEAPKPKNVLSDFAGAYSHPLAGFEGVDYTRLAGYDGFLDDLRKSIDKVVLPAIRPIQQQVAAAIPTSVTQAIDTGASLLLKQPAVQASINTAAVAAARDPQVQDTAIAKAQAIASKFWDEKKMYIIAGGVGLLALMIYLRRK
jgi:hypothetical protein